MRLCVIGLGRMGRRHLQVAKKLNFDLVGVFDPLTDSIRLAQEEQGVPSSVVFDSVLDMLEEVRPEAIVIASTAPSHCEYVLQAANNGVKFILCEKPMATSIDDCNRMVEICTKNNVSLAINHQMRFMEQYTEVKKLVDSASFGGLRSITVSGSNFGIAMNAVHYFEMFRYLTDQDIASINFWADEANVPNPRGREYEDRSGQLRAISTSGVRMYMDIGGDLGYGIQVVYGCRYGQILVDELAGFMRLTARDVEYRDLPTTRYALPSTTRVRQIAPADAIAPTQAVWQAMLDGRSYPDGATGLHAVRTLVAAHLSAESRGELVPVMQADSLTRRFPWA